MAMNKHGVDVPDTMDVIDSVLDFWKTASQNRWIHTPESFREAWTQYRGLLKDDMADEPSIHSFVSLQIMSAVDNIDHILQ